MLLPTRLRPGLIILSGDIEFQEASYAGHCTYPSLLSAHVCILCALSINLHSIYQSAGGCRRFSIHCHNGTKFTVCRGTMAIFAPIGIEVLEITNLQ
jgi:hypothetical protein